MSVFQVDNTTKQKLIEGMKDTASYRIQPSKDSLDYFHSFKSPSTTDPPSTNLAVMADSIRLDSDTGVLRRMSSKKYLEPDSWTHEAEQAKMTAISTFDLTEALEQESRHPSPSQDRQQSDAVNN